MPQPSTPLRGSFVAPTSLWLAGLFVAFYPALLSGFADLQIAPGDPRLVHYILEHAYLWMAGDPQHGSYWSPPVFYPASGVSAFSDTMLGSAPFYGLWRVLGAAPGTAFQLWMIVCLSLTFFVTYALLRRLEARCWPAAAGAFLFAFGIPRLANFNSPQLFPIFYAALALLALSHLLGAGDAGPTSKARQRGWILVFFAALALQTWSTFYPSYFFFLILGASAVVSLAFGDTRGVLISLFRRYPVTITVGALLCAASIGPMASAHLAVSAERGARPFQEVQLGLPGWSSWIFPGKSHAFYAELRHAEVFQFTSASSQHSNGLGFWTLALCLVGLWIERRRPVVRVVGWTSLVILIVFTKVPGSEPGRALWAFAYDVLPGAGAIRYPARVGMFLPLVSAVAVSLLLTRWSASSRRTLALVAGLLCVVEQTHHLRAYSEREYREIIEELAGEVEPDCSAFLLTVEGVAGQRNRTKRAPAKRITQVAAMWVGLAAQRPTVNGFYGIEPRGWELESVDLVGRKQREACEQALARWITRNAIDPGTVDVVRAEAERIPWLRDVR